MKLKGIHIKGVTEKGGKVKPVKKFKSVSQRIADRKSPKTRYGKG